MSSWMTPSQQWQWRIALELKLRSLHGDALQDFFSTVMERAHKSDFVRVRPFGRLGDQGCDGYLQSSGKLYQCYGKIGDAAVNVETLIDKMVDDVGKARAAFPTTMKEWHFVHNLMDGLPSAVIPTIEGIRDRHPAHTIGLAGMEWFVDTVFALPEADIVQLLGPAATAEDTFGLKIEEVRALIDVLGVDIYAAPIDEGDPRPVPAEKLEFNKLAEHWQAFVRSGSQNAQHVANYFARHPEPETGKAVADAFRKRYAALKLQHLAPDRIMIELYIQASGQGLVLPPRSVAAQALLAYLFDACDIFEEKPEAVVSI